MKSKNKLTLFKLKTMKIPKRKIQKFKGKLLAGVAGRKMIDLQSLKYHINDFYEFHSMMIANQSQYVSVSF